MTGNGREAFDPHRTPTDEFEISDTKDIIRGVKYTRKEPSVQYAETKEFTEQQIHELLDELGETPINTENTALMQIQVLGATLRRIISSVEGLNLPSILEDDIRFIIKKIESIHLDEPNKQVFRQIIMRTDSILIELRNGKKTKRRGNYVNQLNDILSGLSKLLNHNRNIFQQNDT